MSSAEPAPLTLPAPSASVAWRNSAVKRYGLAVALVAGALAGTLLLAFNMRSPLFMLAVILSAWIGGRGPGIVAAALATVAIDYFFLPPLRTFSLDPAEMPQLVVFFFAAILVSWWSAGRRRAEETLRHARDQLEAEVAVRTRQASLLDLTHDPIFVRDMNGLLTYWNRAAQEFFGWTAEQALGKNVHELTRAVFPRPPEEIDEELARTGGWEGEVRKTKADGTEVVVATRWALQRDAAGRPTAVLESLNDITERRRAEERIRKLNADLQRRTVELEASNKELEAFSYSVSHDLRAPLRHVAAYSELLQKTASSALDERSRRYVANLQDSAKRMGALIDDLLAFSRIGRAETRMTLVSLDELVREVLREVERETEGRDLAWRVGPLPSVHGDSSMLKLALVNLVSNAVKFTRPRPRAEIEIGSGKGAADEVLVFVRDNGVGFDMKYAGKLFGVFQRLHLPETFEGTGIGLATVQRIVARHGGRVWAEGAVDSGATFHFSLPRP